MHQIMQKQRMQIKKDTSINKQINMNRIIKRKLLQVGCARKDFEDRGLNGYLMAKAKDWSTCTQPISQQTPNPSLGAWIPDHPIPVLWIFSGKSHRITEFDHFGFLVQLLFIQIRYFMFIINVRISSKLEVAGAPYKTLKQALKTEAWLRIDSIETNRLGNVEEREKARDCEKMRIKDLNLA